MQSNIETKQMFSRQSNVMSSQCDGTEQLVGQQFAGLVLRRQVECLPLRTLTVNNE